MSATETQQELESTSDRIVAVLSALYFAPEYDVINGQPTRVLRSGKQGETIPLVTSEERRLERNGALLPEGATSEQAAEHAQAKVDAFRGARGDTEALARHQDRIVVYAKDQSGGIVNLDAGTQASSVADLAEWIKEAKPNVDDTVALAEDDPELAQKVLDAETAATGGKPRQGVAEKLERIVAGS